MRSALVAVTITAMLAIAAPAAAQTATSKSFTLDVRHPLAAACTDASLNGRAVTQGSEAIVEITITNVSKDDQKAGSADVFVPAGYTNVVKVSGPGTLNSDGTVLSYRNMQLRSQAPDNKVTTRLKVNAPQDEGAHVWNAKVRQSETFAETSNDWTNVGTEANRTTHTSATCGVSEQCADGQPCSVTLEHAVPCDYLGCALDGTGDLSIVTTVEAAPADDPLDAIDDSGRLDLVYEAGQSNQAGDGTINANDAEAGCSGYTEPSNYPARFEGPAKRTLTVTTTVSRALWDATGNDEQAPRSCLSADYLFVGEFDDPPKFEFDETDWYNAFLLPCAPGVELQATPCVQSSGLSGGVFTTVDIIPASEVRIGGVDPLRN